MKKIIVITLLLVAPLLADNVLTKRGIDKNQLVVAPSDLYNSKSLN